MENKEKTKNWNLRSLVVNGIVYLDASDVLNVLSFQEVEKIQNTILSILNNKPK